MSLMKGLNKVRIHTLEAGSEPEDFRPLFCDAGAGVSTPGSTPLVETSAALPAMSSSSESKILRCLPLPLPAFPDAELASAPRGAEILLLTLEEGTASFCLCADDGRSSAS